MPDGVVQWYDQKTDEGRIVRGTRRYVARGAEMESAARSPGAVVHFDVRRRGGDVAEAVNVRLRAGTRVSPRQGGFGSLSGARRPDSKGAAPFARPHPEFEHTVHVRPVVVAREWARLVEAGAWEEASSLYAPDAVIHVGERAVTGSRGARRFLESCPWRDAPEPEITGRPQITGREETILVRFAGPGTDDADPRNTWLLVRHGEIAEQWAEGTAPPA